MKLKESSLHTKLCCVSSLFLLAALTVIWQKLFILMCFDHIASDFLAHVELATSHADYGLTSYVIRFLFDIMPSEDSALIAFTLTLTASCILGVLTVSMLISRMLPELDRWTCLLAVLLAHICAPWIIPGWQTSIYMFVFNGNVYHNTTVLFSRIFIPLSFLFSFRIWDARHGKISLRDWLGLALSFLMTTMFKPNFAFAFIPMVGLWLIYDFVVLRGKNIKNNIIIGLAVVPSGLTCIAQYLVLFAEDFAGTSSGMALVPWANIQPLSTAVMYLRCSLLPAYALFMQGRQNKKELRHVMIVIACLFIAILEATFITETGYRANHGNLSWGCLSIYPTFFAIGIGMFFRIWKNADTKKTVNLAIISIGIIILLGHLLTGAYCIYVPLVTEYYYWYFF